MKLYNTQSKSIETFQPRGEEVTIYVCGITPYDTTHLGHAFTYTSADVLIRYLELRGLHVRYAQNVTDIDDDILRKARELGEDWRVVGNRWTKHYIQDMQSLNVRSPDYFPRATDVIPGIIETVKRLIENGVGYQAGGNVYFSIDSWSKFGKLSRLDRDRMLPIANERGNFPDDPNKQDPLDFVLWQAQSPGEPAWDSPWGPGRPGWHIECSTMATELLGEVVDIHGGGADLCFPHHECEIAQVEPLTGEKPFVRFWMHTAMVRHEGEKMSKSLGNLVMVRDLLKTYSPDALRIYLGGHHYRQEWEYNEIEVKQAEKLVKVIAAAVTIPGGEGPVLSPAQAWTTFTLAMDHDLDTPTALVVIEKLAGEIQAAARAGRQVQDAQVTLRRMGTVFGLRLDHQQPEPRVIEGWNAYLPRFS